MAAGRNEGDLRARLTEAAADGLSSARTIDHADRDEGLRFHLGQIAATVMGRRIAVAFDGTDRLVLDVAGQRLSHLRVLDADGDVEIPMRAGDTEAQEAVADLLGELCDGSKRIAVATGPLGHAGAAARGGISATHLAKMLALRRPSRCRTTPTRLPARFSTSPGMR